MRKSKIRSYSTRIEKGGKISFPSVIFGWKVGQRVYFSVKEGGVRLAAKPCGLHNGRILSTRLVKKFSSKHFKVA